MPLHEAAQAIAAVAAPAQHGQVLTVPFEVLGELLHRQVALGRFLAHRALHDGVEVAAQGLGQRRAAGEAARVRHGLRRRRGGLAGCGRHDRDDLSLQLGQGFAAQREDRAAAQQFMQQSTQLVNVAGRGGGFAAQLLGRGIHRREIALLLGGLLQARGVGQRQRPGNAEIDQLRHALAVDDDVAGLDVAMQDQFGVGVLHRVADAAEQVQALGDAQALFVAVHVDGLAAQVFHHVVGLARGALARVEQAGDAGMIERREDFPFALEALSRVLVEAAGVQHLDRDLLLHAAVVALAQIHHAHAAAADFPQQHEGAQARAHGRGHRRGRQRRDGRIGAVRPVSVGRQHRRQRAGNDRVGTALGGDQRLGGGAVQCLGLLEQRLQALPLLRGKRGSHRLRRPCRRGVAVRWCAAGRRYGCQRRRCSQARANFQCRTTVATLISSSTATSSLLSPPK